jgi:hypothetical protein
MRIKIGIVSVILLIVNTALKPQLFAAYPHNQIFS